MRDLMTLMENLFEAQSFTDQFNGILSTVKDPKERESISNWVQTIIEQCRTKLGRKVDEQGVERGSKKDRITWVLRLAKVHVINRACKANGQDPNENKFLKELAAKWEINTTVLLQDFGDMRDAKNYIDVIEHYDSIPALRAVVPDMGIISPNIYNRQMALAEDDWKKKQSQYTDALDHHEVIMDFKDGYVWFNLNEASCDAEAKAMGHCGNSPAAGTSQKILSLRRQTDTGKWHPCLTFILHSDGYLGEMKGRGNEKPAPQYHKYIIPLLRLDMIAGIKGGGYLAANNFSISDLDEDVADELLELKPTLMNAEELYRAEGLTDKTADKIVSAINEVNDKYFFWDGEDLICDEKLYRAVSVKDEDVLEYLEENEVTDSYGTFVETLMGFLKELRPDVLAEIAKHEFGVTPTQQGNLFGGDDLEFQIDSNEFIVAEDRFPVASKYFGKKYFEGRCKAFEFAYAYAMGAEVNDKDQIVIATYELDNIVENDMTFSELDSFVENIGQNAEKYNFNEYAMFTIQKSEVLWDENKLLPLFSASLLNRRSYDLYLKELDKQAERDAKRAAEQAQGTKS
jgi:hypothetical protein